MEFMTGVKKKEDISVKTLLETPEGTEVKLEGAVHIIRDMGEVAFVILRKSEGLVQCVYEEGSVDFPLKDLKEESAVAVTGTVKKEDRAPGGVEVRLQTITVLSEPTEPMPLAVNKWKMNTSLEAMPFRLYSLFSFGMISLANCCPSISKTMSFLSLIHI